MTATDHNLLPEIRAYIAKARLRRGIELVKLANRIESLRMQEDEDDTDMPSDSKEAAEQGVATHAGAKEPTGEGKRSLGKAAKGAIFREVVLAKVREMKELEEKEKIEKSATEKAKRMSSR